MSTLHASPSATSCRGQFGGHTRRSCRSSTARCAQCRLPTLPSERAALDRQGAAQESNRLGLGCAHGRHARHRRPQDRRWHHRLGREHLPARCHPRGARQHRLPVAIGKTVDQAESLYRHVLGSGYYHHKRAAVMAGGQSGQPARRDDENPAHADPARQRDGPRRARARAADLGSLPPAGGRQALRHEHGRRDQRVASARQRLSRVGRRAHPVLRSRSTRFWPATGRKRSSSCTGCRPRIASRIF